MAYSDFFRSKEKKIPFPLSIVIILVIILSLGRILSSNPSRSKASNKVVRNMTVVNPAPSEFALYWLTDTKEMGWVIYGSSPNNLDKIALDERDLQNQKNAYYHHFVRIRDLNLGTTYYYKIVSDNQVVASENEPFSFTTLQSFNPGLQANPAYGKVIQNNGDPLENAIIILHFKGAIPLLAITKTTGEWLIPLNGLVNKEDRAVLSFKDSDVFTLDIFSEEKDISHIQVSPSNISPLPQTIIIGKNYTFLGSDNVLAVSSEANRTKSETISVLFPQEGALIPGNTPIIKGTAIIGNEITGLIESQNKYTFKTSADKNGEWKVAVAKPFLPGDYLLTVTTKNKEGQEIRLSRKFSIAKSGEQVLGEATAEATPTLIPTVAPTIAPTLYSTPSITTSSATTITPPTSGFSFLPIAIGSASLVIVGLGILFIF